MTSKKVTIIYDMISYVDFYEKNRPKNEKPVVYRVHKLIGKVVAAQCENIIELSDLVDLNDKVDAMICRLRGEFNLVNKNLDICDYPNFVKKIQKGTFFEELNEYNASVVEVLKIVFFRISKSQNENQAEKYVFGELNSIFNGDDSQLNESFLFIDDAEPALSENQETDAESMLKAIVRDQIDISL